MKHRIATVACALALMLGLAAPNQAEARSAHFGRLLAGTYFLDEGGDFQRLLTLTADGNLFGIDSSEAVGDTFFGDQQGVWTRTGRRTIAATVINFRFSRQDDGTVTRAGSALADYRIRFSRAFRKVEGTITLQFFDAGVDPLAPDSEPTADFPITFDFEGQRIPAPIRRPR